MILSTCFGFCKRHWCFLGRQTLKPYKCRSSSSFSTNCVRCAGQTASVSSTNWSCVLCWTCSQFLWLQSPLQTVQGPNGKDILKKDYKKSTGPASRLELQVESGEKSRYDFTWFFFGRRFVCYTAAFILWHFVTCCIYGTCWLGRILFASFESFYT